LGKQFDHFGQVPFRVGDQGDLYAMDLPDFGRLPVVMLRTLYAKTRAPNDWRTEDLRAAAEFRNGKCLAGACNGPDAPAAWESAAANKFIMTPRLYLKAGH
jgi:hypothetical protein